MKKILILGLIASILTSCASLNTFFDELNSDKKYDSELLGYSYDLEDFLNVPGLNVSDYDRGIQLYNKIISKIDIVLKQKLSRKQIALANDIRNTAIDKLNDIQENRSDAIKKQEKLQTFKNDIATYVDNKKKERESIYKTWKETKLSVYKDFKSLHFPPELALNKPNKYTLSDIIYAIYLLDKSVSVSTDDKAINIKFFLDGSSYTIEYGITKNELIYHAFYKGYFGLTGGEFDNLMENQLPPIEYL